MATRSERSAPPAALSNPGGSAMGYTLEQFSAECHRILKADPGPEGRQKVCALVRDMCKDEAFVAANLGDDVPDRKVLYEDPELGFCILGHVHKDTQAGSVSPTITALPGRSTARQRARRL